MTPSDEFSTGTTPISDINHQLASGNKFDIKEAFAIASHPQALGQCNKWIEKNIGSIKRLSLSARQFKVVLMTPSDEFSTGTTPISDSPFRT